MLTARAATVRTVTAAITDSAPITIIALTNSIAFSPTDAMPLSHRAKMVMGAESVIAAVTVLTVAARAVNILR